MTEPRTPVLETERIDRMRTHVLDTIAEDERLRTRRSRRRARVLLGGAAAAAVVVVGGVGVGIAGRGMQQGSDDSSAAGDAAGVPSLDQTYESAPDAGDDDAPFTDTVITTGSVALRVDDTPAAVDAIATWAAGHGGRIDAENLSDGDEATYADVTVRVPGDQVGALRKELADLGTITSVDVQRADVSTQVADVEARIDSLEASIRRLRAIIAESGTTKDLLDAETQLAQRQGELESLQAQRRLLHDQTSLATISVSVSESEAAQSVEPSGFVGGLTRGWNGLVATTNVAVTAAGVLVPWLLPLGAVAAVALALRRRVSRPR